SDMPQQQREQVDVFLDYENVRRTGREVFLYSNSAPHEGMVDPLALAQTVVSKRKRDSILRKVHVFRGRPNPLRQPKPHSAFEHFAARWSQNESVVTHFRDLKYVDHDPGFFTAMEKGVDVALAVQLINSALSPNSPDAIILMSNDTDLEPAVEFVLEQTSTHIEIAAWSGEGSYPLYLRKYISQNPPRYLPYCHFLTKADFDRLRCDYELYHNLSPHRAADERARGGGVDKRAAT
ncbi:NYN domain-containing protein, partial [Corynebacterium sanguinis]